MAMTLEKTSASSDWLTPIQARFKHCYSGASAQSSFLLDVDLSLPGKGITALFGPSGSGKTTLLRCLAGLETAEQGELVVAGELWQRNNVVMPTHKRPLSYVFQESSLLPHLTALANIQYAIKRAQARVSAGEIDRIVDLMGLAPLLHQLPQQLSGGERQRVAMARALVTRPRLLLMDEPLASLDTARKQEILPYLLQLRESCDSPIIYVSHSVDEVAQLADFVVALKAGAVVAKGTVTEVFSDIHFSALLAHETGAVLHGVITERDHRWGLMCVAFNGGTLWLRDSGGDTTTGQPVRLRILARDISLALSNHCDTSIINRLQAIVTELVAEPNGAMALVKVKAGACQLLARLTRKSVHDMGLEVGKPVWAQVKSAAIM
ncbi:MAG TPA: molybdenum ABC transporter ATP-binding protein [Marinagarivorans sp.]